MIAEKLNGVVKGILDTASINPEDSPEIIKLCRRVATDAGFSLSSSTHPENDGTSDCDQVEQYVDRRGNTVNLWIVDVQGVGFADGGLGFED